LNNHEPSDAIPKKSIFRALLFPASVLVIYGILFAVIPDKASMALGCSGKIFLNIVFPLCVVFVFMLLFSLFIKPSHVAKFFDKGPAIRGVMLTAMAGILSMGPIYAWYPLLKGLREKGVKNTFIAIFLGNRAVKPFLLPVMISYFGWDYALILTFLTILGTLPIGYTVGALIKE
jgi:uncharacterized membrane protein YraQ (UPF0718 family)